MKLKPNSEKSSVIKGIKTIYSSSESASQCIISIDIDGFVTLENFKNVKDYRSDRIVIETKQKNVYIYGTDMSILSCNKHTAISSGVIKKIEIFDKEV